MICSIFSCNGTNSVFLKLKKQNKTKHSCQEKHTILKNKMVSWFSLETVLGFSGNIVHLGLAYYIYLFIYLFVYLFIYFYFCKHINV